MREIRGRQRRGFYTTTGWTASTSLIWKKQLGIHLLSRVASFKTRLAVPRQTIRDSARFGLANRESQAQQGSIADASCLVLFLHVIIRS